MSFYSDLMAITGVGDPYAAGALGATPGPDFQSAAAGAMPHINPLLALAGAALLGPAGTPALAGLYGGLTQGEQAALSQRNIQQQLGTAAAQQQSQAQYQQGMLQNAARQTAEMIRQNDRASYQGALDLLADPARLGTLSQTPAGTARLHQAYGVVNTYGGKYGWPTITEPPDFDQGGAKTSSAAAAISTNAAPPAPAGPAPLAPPPPPGTGARVTGAGVAGPLPPGVQGPAAPPGSLTTPHGTVVPPAIGPAPRTKGGAAPPSVPRGAPASLPSASIPQVPGLPGPVEIPGLPPLTPAAQRALQFDPLQADDQLRAQNPNMTIEQAQGIVGQEQQQIASSLNAQDAASLQPYQIVGAALNLGKTDAEIQDTLARAGYQISLPGIETLRIQTQRMIEGDRIAAELRGQNVQARGQNIEANTAANRLAFDQSKEAMDADLHRLGLVIQQQNSGFKLTELYDASVRGETQQDRVRRSELQTKLQNDLNLAYANSPLRVPGTKFVFTPGGTLGGAEWDVVRKDILALGALQNSSTSYLPKSPEETAILNAPVTPKEQEDVQRLIAGQVPGQTIGSAYGYLQQSAPARAVRMLRIYRSIKRDPNIQIPAATAQP